MRPTRRRERGRGSMLGTFRCESRPAGPAFRASPFQIGRAARHGMRGGRIKNKALRKKARRHKHTLLNVRESRSAVQSRDQALTCARAACGYQVNVAPVLSHLFVEIGSPAPYLSISAQGSILRSARCTARPLPCSLSRTRRGRTFGAAFSNTGTHFFHLPTYSHVLLPCPSPGLCGGEDGRAGVRPPS